MATTLQDRLRGAAQTFSDHPPTFGLLFEAADALDALQHDLAEARRIAGRHSTELGHLRKLHMPDGFRSALTDKGEPAAFVPIGPIEPGSVPGFYRLTPTNAPALLQASVNALRDRWAAETERRLRDLEVGQRLAGCLPSLDWPADWRVLKPGESPPLGREWTIWGPMTPQARALADRDASIPEARRLLGIAGDPTIHIVAEERGCQPGACLAEPRCRNRAEMRAAHGTPAEFAAAITRAAPELLGSEAERAIVTYNAAWAAATEPSAEVQRALNSELAAMGCDPASATQAEFKRALWEVMKTKAVAEELQAAELVPPAERSSTMARIERWKKRQPTTPGAETYDFTPEQEAEAAEQAERFQGLDDSDRD
jgi:hypothetical protein